MGKLRPAGRSKALLATLSWIAVVADPVPPRATAQDPRPQPSQVAPPRAPDDAPASDTTPRTPAADGVADSPAAETSIAGERTRDLRTRAKNLRALVDGSLDPAVRLQTLFMFDLTDPAFATRDQWIEILDRVDEPPPTPRGKRRARKAPLETPPDPDTLSPEQDLRLALNAFLRLPADRRSALIEAHRSRRALEQAKQARDQQLWDRLETATTAATQLRAFLEGELAVEADPRQVLSLALQEPGQQALTARLSRLSSMLTSDGSPAGAQQPPPAPTTADAGIAASPEPSTIDERLDAANLEFDRQLARYLALDGAQRQELFERHGRRQEAAERDASDESVQQQQATAAADRAREAAEEAAEKRVQALEAARTAKSHSLRLMERERARLHAIEEAQARYEQTLSEESGRLASGREDVLEWTDQATTLQSRAAAGHDVSREAAATYRRISLGLDSLHSDLDAALRRLAVRGQAAVPLGELLDDELLHEEHRGQLTALWSSLVHKDSQLRELASDLRSREASALRDSIVALNRARLAVLAMTGPSHRDQTTSLGEGGLTEARRELRQLVLELRYHALELPVHLSHLQRQLLHHPLPAASNAGQLLLILLLFRWWRKNADRMMTRLRHDMRQRTLQDSATRFIAGAAWYVRRIHGPLDWLVLFWAVLGMTDVLPELRFVRMALAWILGGTAVVRVLDAIASRQQLRARRQASSAQLRLRSLRLIGLTVVVLGLVLSIAEASVGRGVIYNWTITLCWALALPLFLLLVYWWRHIIFERLEMRASSDPIAGALAARGNPLLAVPAAIGGGAYLFATGLLSWARDELYEFEITRRILAYVLRTQVTRHSRVAGLTSGRPASQLSEVQARFFRPEAKIERLVNYASDELRAVVQRTNGSTTTLTAVVGERGRGKTSFLRRVRDRVGERAILLECPRGPDELLGTLAAAVGADSDTDAAELSRSLQEARIRAICIDDVQRLVRPTIRGLERLDAIEELARAMGGGITWLLAIDAPAWSFISRAFGDRVAFDEVVELPSWTEAQLGDLIRSRTELAGLDPEFDDLMAKRQMAEIDEESEERIENSFYRIIWDSSDGNAAVALCYWRDSLWLEESGAVSVRMFDESAAATVESSPLQVLFVLRSVLQMDRASEDDLVDATNLTPGQVHNAIRYSVAREFLDVDDGNYWVTWRWFRPVTRVLRRKRLLVM